MNPEIFLPFFEQDRVVSVSSSIFPVNSFLVGLSVPCLRIHTPHKITQADCCPQGFGMQHQHYPPLTPMSSSLTADPSWTMHSCAISLRLTNTVAPRYNEPRGIENLAITNGKSGNTVPLPKKPRCSENNPIANSNHSQRHLPPAPIQYPPAILKNTVIKARLGWESTTLWCKFDATAGVNSCLPIATSLLDQEQAKVLLCILS